MAATLGIINTLQRLSSSGVDVTGIVNDEVSVSV